LTSQQALQDAAYFIEFLTSNLTLGDSKWIVFGGSYSGSLSVWFRSKYPHLVVGAIASSAPVQAIVDFKDYFGVVSNSLGTKCDDSIKEATDQLTKLLTDPFDWKSINENLRLCDPFNGTILNDVHKLMKILADDIAKIVQFNKDNIAYEVNMRKIESF